MEPQLGFEGFGEEHWPCKQPAAHRRYDWSGVSSQSDQLLLRSGRIHTHLLAHLPLRSHTPKRQNTGFNPTLETDYTVKIGSSATWPMLNDLITVVLFVQNTSGFSLSIS